MDLKQRVILINRIHLFNGLKEDQLAEIAEKFAEKTYEAGMAIFKRNDKPDGFYIIIEGKVDVVRPDPQQGNRERRLIWLAKGDYFGEEALVERRNRSATVKAVQKTSVLFLSREYFEALLNKFPILKPNFIVAIKSHKLSRACNFKWLGDDEIIYFIARRHKIRLYQALVAPILSLLAPLFFFAWALLTGATTPWALGIVTLLFSLGWIAWNAVDWSNDYYIVTNTRVIWLEKVIGLYDSREEAPLSTILSVGVETDQLGRMLDYGNVIVRTFVGRIEFDYVDHPNQAAGMIREYWERVKSITTISQKELMKNTIREKLGLPVEKRSAPEPPPVFIADRRDAQRSLWILALRQLFNLRQEDAGKVIYHKHWIVLLQQAWQPFAAFLAILALQIWRGIYLWNSETASFIQRGADGKIHLDTITLALPLIAVPFVIWAVWEYVDWKNDIFMVTGEEIFDIDRKPFGKEEKRAAQIDSILSTSYTREGFIAYLFNYGTVKITVGGAQFDFQDVADPAGVQADIDRRRMARIAKKNENAGKDDRERFATWIAAYHENRAEFEKPIVPKEEKKQ